MSRSRELVANNDDEALYDLLLNVTQCILLALRYS